MDGAFEDWFEATLLSSARGGRRLAQSPPSRHRCLLIKMIKMTRARIAARSAEQIEPTDALLAGKVQRKVSNGVAALAAGGASLDRQKSRPIRALQRCRATIWPRDGCADEFFREPRDRSAPPPESSRPAEAAVGAAAQSAKVVNLANWSDDDSTGLELHEPETTDIVITFESRH